MASSLNTPILTVDVALIHKIDTKNVEHLFSMWRGELILQIMSTSSVSNSTTVFSRCSRSLEEGHRLENLSWRVWTRETFCCDPVSGANATTPAITIASRSSEGLYEVPVPTLSGSVDSLADELESESDQTPSTTSAPGPLGISRSQIHRQDSVSSRSRGRDRHITPDDLEKMVITIKEKKDLEPITLNIHPYSPPATITISSSQEDESADIAPFTPDSVANPSVPSLSSESASGASERSATSVVRGFSPSHVSSSYRSIPLLTAPSSVPTADIVAANTSQGPQPKRLTMFALGGCSGKDSLSEQTNSMEKNMEPKKKAMLSFGGSSKEDGSSLPAKIQKPQSGLANNMQRPLVQQKKQTSFQEEVATRTLDDQQYSNDVFETDEEDVDKSAIEDDDDSSDWEDSVEERGSIDDKSFFKRVDSRAHLTTRRSLITTMLHQNDRATALAAAASRSTPALQRSRTTSPNGLSLAASSDSDDGSLLMMKKTNLKPIAEIPRSSGPAPQPIIHTTSNGYHQLALSPRTTRRNMLATELTFSLRQHLLWERQQKSQTANAVLKRRHTARDVANLKQYPDKVHMGENGDEMHASWNQYFSTGLGEYHSKGW